MHYIIHLNVSVYSATMLIPFLWTVLYVNNMFFKVRMFRIYISDVTMEASTSFAISKTVPANGKQVFIHQNNLTDSNVVSAWFASLWKIACSRYVFSGATVGASARTKLSNLTSQRRPLSTDGNTSNYLNHVVPLDYIFNSMKLLAPFDISLIKTEIK